MNEHMDTEGLLINIIEEASEVAQIAAKCLRFGLYNFDPNDPERTKNNVLLGRELGNLEHLKLQAIHQTTINSKDVADGIFEKHDRLRTYPLIIKEQPDEKR